ncbi:hypothetical protein [Pedobacter jamesrossensis]
MKKRKVSLNDLNEFFEERIRLIIFSTHKLSIEYDMANEKANDANYIGP